MGFQQLNAIFPGPWFPPLVFYGNHAKDVRLPAVDQGVGKAIQVVLPGILWARRSEGREFGDQFDCGFHISDGFRSQPRSLGLVRINSSQEFFTGRG